MVDSIGGVAASQNIQNIKTNQTQKTEKATTAPGAVDEVSLSDEALSLSQSEVAAAQVRSLLEADQDQTLSSGGRVDALL